MIIKEFRIVLPISVDEYQVGQLYAVAEASKNETGGGEGVEVLKNEPYTSEETGQKGQYTHKIYHLKSKVPNYVTAVAPAGSLSVHEKAWNAYPYCRTIITNEYMKEKMEVKIETWHKSDMGDSENVHELEEAEWKKVKVDHINIADEVSRGDYKAEEDPTKFHSVKTGRGPLGPDWQEKLRENPNCPHMCAYKLVTIRFDWKLIGGQVEKLIAKTEKRLFTNFHRQLFCLLDKWHGLTMDEIRDIEEQTKKDLDEMRQKGEVRGMQTQEK